MRQLLALVILCAITGRLIEASLASSHPLAILAPNTLAALTACTMCLMHMFRKEE